jgi:hypothetical protein
MKQSDHQALMGRLVSDLSAEQKFNALHQLLEEAFERLDVIEAELAEPEPQPLSFRDKVFGPKGR